MSSPHLTPHRDASATPDVSRHHRPWTVALRGTLIGAADLVPGVSGGTMAIILGLYDRLIVAIASLTGGALRRAVSRRAWREAWHVMDGTFLVSLGLGIGVAIVTLASILDALLTRYPSYLYAVFFGLIAVSSVVVMGRIPSRRTVAFLFAIPAAVMAYLIAVAAPVETPGTAPWLFGSGFLAVSALLLPGVSGAFILLLLGQYARVVEAVSTLDVAILAPFAVGMVAGGLIFARILGRLLVKAPAATHGALAGFLVGSLRKVWPWQTDDAASAAMMLPGSTSEALLAGGLAVTAIAAVILLERLARRPHG